MKTNDKNPPGNVLKNGVLESDLKAAIASSGYPLQTLVARQLRPRFTVQEEWSFVDSEAQVLRSLDLIAQRPLWDKSPGSRVRPTLDLIVECKRSDLPYVFFLSDEPAPIPRFPFIAGLKSEEVSISTDDTASTWTVYVMDVVGLERHEFVVGQAAFATTFAKCERQGSKLKLSGSEPYSEIVYPLVKALEHFGRVEAPPDTAVYFDLHFVIALAVVDAPMVGVRPTGNGHDSELVPWVRIPRHRSLEEARSHEHNRNVYAIDVVHFEFLDQYIEQHLLPFADEFSTRALKHSAELANGAGFVSGMGENWYRDLESRVVPRGAREAMRRVSGAAKRMSRGLSERKSK